MPGTCNMVKFEVPKFKIFDNHPIFVMTSICQCFHTVSH